MLNPEYLLSFTLQSIRDAVVTTDRAARVLMLSRAAETMTGWSTTEAAGRSIDEIVELRKANGVHLLLQPTHAVLRDGTAIEIAEQAIAIGKDGRHTSVQITAAPLHDAENQVEGCVLVLHDITEAQQLAERLAYRAHHDPLTGLPNRILLVDRLEQGTKFSDRHTDHVAVFSLDLDRFSQIKITYGNAIADELLIEAASRMSAALRESDTICRLGADEFVIMVPSVKSLADLEGVASKLLEEIAKPCTIGEHTLQITCSIGIGIYPRDARDAETLMRLADVAMRQAKRNGGNRYLFTEAC
jgi:diguanylate cyclase (GGDEF)-like protein/PAS domain S-box-containing protein